MAVVTHAGRTRGLVCCWRCRGGRSTACCPRPWVQAGKPLCCQAASAAHPRSSGLAVPGRWPAAAKHRLRRGLNDPCGGGVAILVAAKAAGIEAGGCCASMRPRLRRLVEQRQGCCLGLSSACSGGVATGVLQRLRSADRSALLSVWIAWLCGGWAASPATAGQSRACPAVGRDRNAAAGEGPDGVPLQLARDGSLMPCCEQPLRSAGSLWAELAGRRRPLATATSRKPG